MSIQSDLAANPQQNLARYYYQRANPKILGGVSLEILTLLINILNVLFFLIPDIIKGILLGALFSLTG